MRHSRLTEMDPHLHRHIHSGRFKGSVQKGYTVTERRTTWFSETLRILRNILNIAYRCNRSGIKNKVQVIGGGL